MGVVIYGIRELPFYITIGNREFKVNHEHLQLGHK